MSLPYHYELEWKWHAESGFRSGFNPPSEANINDVMAQKVAQKFIEEYVKRGWAIQIGSVSTVTSRSEETRPHRILGYVSNYKFDGTTKVDFWTDHKAMGSPIDPATAMAIIAFCSAVSAVVVPLLYFLVFNTVTTTIRDIGTGIGEVFGVKDFGGLGILFLIILLIIGLWVVGKYWKPWRKRR